jgi:hypothetical protein
MVDRVLDGAPIASFIRTNCVDTDQPLKRGVLMDSSLSGKVLLDAYPSF